MDTFNDYKLLILETLKRNEEAIEGFATELKSSLKGVYKAIAKVDDDTSSTLRWYLVFITGIIGSVFGYAYLHTNNVEARLNTKVIEAIVRIEKSDERFVKHQVEQSREAAADSLLHYQLKVNADNIKKDK